MKKKAYRILGYFTLVLFISYYINISFFSHTHMVNGIKITHSHFYKGFGEDQPVQHEHTTQQIQLISVITQLNIENIPGTPAIKASSVLSCSEYVIPDNILIPVRYTGEIHLRAPPYYL